MLRSGNGQHRRPRQAPAFVVTAGATGAGIALPLLAATGAHAATSSTWDKVAQCESGGLWSENNGNGFYGGLQLTLSTWQEYGGGAYAERPDLASRQEQIAIAEKVLEGEGVAAWQDCAVDAGLTQGGPAPVVDPGNPSGTPGNSRTRGNSGNSAAVGNAAAAGRQASGWSGLSDGLDSAAPSAGQTPAVGAAPSSPGGSAAPSADPSASAVPSASPSAIPTLTSATPAVSASQGAPAAPSRGRHAKPLAEGVESAVPTQGDATTAGASTATSDPRTTLVDSGAQRGG